MDSVIQNFMSILHTKQGERLDLGVWLQLFAFGMSQTAIRKYGN